MKQRFFLPTYEECVAITQANESFYEKKCEVNGIPVSIFNYRLSQYKDFETPVEGTELKAYELRGITFVHTNEGPKRYLMLHKFFNLNQVPGYQYDEVKDFLVARTQDKVDGSMIRFLNIGGQLVAKTKMDFTNDQCSMAMQSAVKQGLTEFIQKTLDANLVAIFEVVSAFNRIVVLYPETEIRLLQLRDEYTGEYLDIYSHPLVKEYQVKCTTQETVQALNSYMERAQVEENIEGWVLTLNNGQMLKIKTQWYCQLHGLLTENLVRENKILEMILTETLDDALAQLEDKDPRRKYNEDIQGALIKYLDQELHKVMDLKSKYQGSRKDFALAYKSNPLFGIAVKLVEDSENVEDKAYAMLKTLVGRKTSGLMDAKRFVADELGVKLQHLDESFDEDN